MKKHLMRMLLLSFALLIFLPSTPANAFCEEYPDIFCHTQCGGSVGIWCAEPSNLGRCCFDAGIGGGACGEATYCPECDCFGYGLF